MTALTIGVKKFVTEADGVSAIQLTCTYKCDSITSKCLLFLLRRRLSVFVVMRDSSSSSHRWLGQTFGSTEDDIMTRCGRQPGKIAE